MESTQTRAQLAKEILENPLWQEMFAAINGEFHEQWESCPDASKRDRIWIMNSLLTRLQTMLETYIADGRIEDFEERRSKIATLFNRG